MLPPVSAFFLALGLSTASAPARAGVTPTLVRPHRLVVLTDIENEPDDTESMVRLLLYSNVIDLQGLVATTSTHLRDRIAPESIRHVIDAYAKVRDNLLRHEPGFPTAATLQSLVKSGQAEYGLAAVGAGKDSEGSDWIIHVLDEPDDRPLWVSVWGGPNTLAQALFKLRATRSAGELNRLVAKLRVYTISDQDDTGPWLRKNFPDLFYIVSPGGYGAATWGGMNQAVPGLDNTTISNRWLADHIQQGHGPLGAVYPDVAYGMEGDSPSWLALIPNGLSVPEHPEWGGWGGRYELRVPALEEMDPKGFTGGVPIEPETRPIWTNTVDEVTPPVSGEHGRAMRAGDKAFKDFRATVWRWRDDFQNDFAARMAWTTQPRAAANHPPVPVLAPGETFTVKSGEHFALDAHGSSDPDGDSISYWWFQYPEAGTYRGQIPIQGAANTIRVNLVAPIVDQPATAHFILRVTDKGSPSLTRYRRVIVTIVPK
ncbi:MAG TPA: nucleoside hydrolase-like domain-containing protein [Lacunisphaera sp.]|nr:nucleoside hydrolase-like domain-containing protein [Lacunisphaera sp.]